jgi:hypothetical protein
MDVHTFQMALEVPTFQMALEVHTFQMSLEVHTFQMVLEVHTFQMALEVPTYISNGPGDPLTGTSIDWSIKSSTGVLVLGSTSVIIMAHDDRKRVHYTRAGRVMAKSAVLSSNCQHNEISKVPRSRVPCAT